MRYWGVGVRLEDITVTLRPRNPWEAMDLGIGLVRQNWRRIYGPWFAVVLPFFALLNFLLQDMMWLAFVLFWWFKPLYDRMMLYVLSQALFGTAPRTGDTVRALPSLFKTGLFAHLTLLRLDLARAFNLPVWQLEGLRGRARRERQRVLQVRSRSHAVWLLITAHLIEIWVVYLSLFMLIQMFVPPGVEFNIFTPVFDEQPTYWTALLSNGLYFLAVTLIEPLYAAGGFTLYLNRRTQLEGWDIELAFRRMAARLEALTRSAAAGLAGFALAGMLAAGLLASTPVLAQEEADSQDQAEATEEFLADERLPAASARAVIEDVLNHEEFQTRRKVKEWRLKEKEKEKKDEEELDIDAPDLGFLEQLVTTIARVGEAVLWIAAAILVALLILYRDRWLHLILRNRAVMDEYEPPEALFGMDIRPESLPHDIPGEARALWGQRQHRMALSLLYRGALAVLVNRDKVELSHSNTEGDVLTLSRLKLRTESSEYLAGLTTAWQTVAYAHRPPLDAQALQLCDQWNRHFGGPATGEAT